MGRVGGLAAGAICAAALVAAPAAQASTGSDSVSRWDTISYRADPGEANDVLVERWNGDGLHLRDRGAIIRWLGAPAPGVKQCTGGGHDVWCLGGYGGVIDADLGDASDRYVATTWVPGTLALGAGNDVVTGGPGGQEIDGGPGDDRITGGGSEPNLNGGPFPEILTGGPGRDQLRGDVGPRGEVAINARDGEVDRIWCGADIDHVDADAIDVIETPGACENVALG